MFLLLHGFKRFARDVRHIPAGRFDSRIEQYINARFVTRSGMLDSIAQEIDDLYEQW